MSQPLPFPPFSLCYSVLVFTRLKTEPVAPFRPELSELLLRPLPLAEMRCVSLACPPEFSNAREIQGGRPRSSSLPAIPYTQTFGRVTRAHPCGQRSCAE